MQHPATAPRGQNVEPSPPRPTSSLELAALPNAVPLARCHTNAFLRSWLLPPEVIETAELLVSELATNALPRNQAHHGSTRTYPELADVQRCWLRLRLTDQALVIEMRDTDPRPPVRQWATDDAESGRGLLLIEALSHQWGYYYEGPYKIVWCEVACVLTIR